MAFTAQDEAKLKRDLFLVAQSSLLIATKMEESPTRIGDIIRIFYRIMMLRTNALSSGDEISIDQIDMKRIDNNESVEYKNIEHEVKKMEMDILVHFKFNIYQVIDRIPHKLLLWFIERLSLPLDVEQKQFAQSCWNYLNDSMTCIDIYADIANDTDIAERVCVTVVALNAEAMNISLSSDWFIPFLSANYDPLDTAVGSIIRSLNLMYSIPMIPWNVEDRYPALLEKREEESQMQISQPIKMQKIDQERVEIEMPVITVQEHEKDKQRKEHKHHKEKKKKKHRSRSREKSHQKKRNRSRSNSKEKVDRHRSRDRTTRYRSEERRRKR